jgi:hypothetical protein
MNMVVTLNESRPIGLCVATEELFDTKRFLLNYCDGMILKGQDQLLRNRLISVKRDLNSFSSQPKFLQGYKAIMVSNMDKIIGLVSSRFPTSANPHSSRIVADAKGLMAEVLKAENFQDISKLEANFRSRVTLPTYKLFTSVSKEQGTRFS